MKTEREEEEEKVGTKSGRKSVGETRERSGMQGNQSE